MFSDSITWYLFLGGGGAGAVTVLALCDLLFGRWSKRPEHLRPRWTGQLSSGFFMRGYLLAGGALVLGALCLLLDLAHPERFLYVLLYPTFSVLTFGSYVLSATVVCAVALGGIALFGTARTPVVLVRALEACAAVFGVSTMAYTGVLLSEIGFVPLWGSPLLPVLFTCSSLSVGAAVALAGAWPSAAETPHLMRALSRADSMLIVVEAVALAAYLAFAALALGQGGAVETLLTGPNAELFWIGFVGAGLAGPLALDAAYAVTRTPSFLAVAVPFVLVGGFFLRYCIVNVQFV
ncbi:NrfD/PsrC family molybdoenzyme membrane anchor subunit [Eggerthella sinensis]|uniref:NrfD/PsrC family molybdoenzyme membrane anchor subunit n=1 Tax=Eggerthella sinensis TaxID=242230 RepID=UPI00266B9467|nr:NrfD/PsrC family molybdoenzyme membrane anchor subunit [Eggerthella sinensis]